MTPKTVPLWGNASPGQGNLQPKMKVGPREGCRGGQASGLSQAGRLCRSGRSGCAQLIVSMSIFTFWGLASRRTSRQLYLS